MTAEVGEEGDAKVAAGEACALGTHAVRPTRREDTLSLADCATASTRLVSAFRGRTVHGLKVDLPEGYGGIILRTDGDGEEDTPKVVEGLKGKRAETSRKVKVDLKANRKGRSIRNSLRAMETKVDGSGDDVTTGIDPEDAEGELNEEVVARTLQPSATFPSFVVWHPDIPVDETRDEYIRSLTEWTRLATHVRRQVFLSATEVLSFPLRYINSKIPTR
jgi:hypothetical protein